MTTPIAVGARLLSFGMRGKTEKPHRPKAFIAGQARAYRDGTLARTGLVNVSPIHVFVPLHASSLTIGSQRDGRFCLYPEGTFIVSIGSFQSP